MIVIVPSRGRPQRAANMVQSVRETAAGDVRVLVVVDPDDPTLPDYQRKVTELLVQPERRRFAQALNAVVTEVWDSEDILGAYGDDVLFRTPGWDLRIREALDTPGIAFGNDLAHKNGHPTAVFMSSAIARGLGYFALPACRHLYVDDAWKAIGEDLGVLRYLPDVVFEHMHEVYGKAVKDQTYIDVYDDNGKHDHDAFHAWRAAGMAEDIARLRAAL